MSEPHRVAGGHKAAINNPNVPEETKEHSRQVLDQMEKSGELDYEPDSSANKNPGNVIGGKKAAIHNDNVPEETKERLRGELADQGIEVE